MGLKGAALDTAAISTANTTMATGGFTGLAGFLLSINWLGLIGATVAVIGLAANIYFQLRRDKREHLEHLERLESLRSGNEEEA